MSNAGGSTHLPPPSSAEKTASNTNGNTNHLNVLNPRKPLTEEELMQMHEKIKNARNSKTARRMARNKDTIKDLLDNIKRSPRFTNLLIYNINIFPSLAVDETSVEELIEEGVLEALMHVQQLNPMNEAINKVINDCIAAFCINDYCTWLVHSRVGLGSVPYSLKMHKEPETLSSACNALNRLMRLDNGVKMFVDENVVGILGNVVKDMVAEPVVISQAAKALTRICECDKTQIAAVVDVETLLPNILSTLKENPKDKDLHKNVMELLAVLSLDPALLEYLRNLNIIDIVAETVQLYVTPEILNLGSIIMGNISDNNDVLNLLKYQGTDANMVNILTKLAALVLVDSNILAFLENGGVAWLLNIMKECVQQGLTPVTESLLSLGCQILNRVAKSSYAATYSVIENGGLDVIQDILTKFMAQNEKVAIDALLTCKAMLHPESGEFIVDYDLFKNMDALAATYPNSEDTALLITDMFVKLSSFAGLHPLLLANDIVNRTLYLMRKFKDNEAIVANCLTTLKQLSTTKPGVDAIMQARIQDYVPGITGAFAGNENIAERLLLCLKQIMETDNEANVELSGTKNEIVTYLDSVKTNEALTKLGTEVLELFTKKGQSTALYYVRKVYDSAGKVKEDTSDEASIQALHMNLGVLKNLSTDSSKLQELLTANAQASLVRSISASLALPVTSDVRNTIFVDAFEALKNIMHSNTLPAVLEKPAIFDAFKHFNEQGENCNEDEVEVAMELLAKVFKLAKKRNMLQPLLDSDIVSQVMNLAGIFNYNKKIQSSALTIASCTTASDANIVKDYLGNDTTKQVLMNGFQAQLNDSKDIAYTLNHFVPVTEIADAISSLITVPYAELLTNTLDKHMSNDVVVDNALANIVGMFHHIKEEEFPILLDQFRKAGLISKLLTALNTHYGDEDIVGSIFSTLSCLAGNVDCLEELLTLYPNIEDLVAWVKEQHLNSQIIDADVLLKAVENHRLFLSSDEEKLRRKQEQVEKITQQLMDLTNSPDTNQIYKILQQLEDMCTDPEITKMLAKNGGLQSIAQILLNNLHDEHIFNKCTHLHNLMTQDVDDEIMNILEMDSLLDMQVEILKPHIAFETTVDEKYKDHILGLLSNCSLGDNTCLRLLNNQGLSTISQIIVQVNNPRMLEHSSKILGAASFNDDVNDAFIRGYADGSNGFSTIRELIDAMRKHITNQEFLRYGVFLLSSLAIDDGIKSEIGIQSGIHLIITIIQRYLNTNYNLVKNCFVALAQLTYLHAINCAFVAACNAIPIVIQALETYTTAVELLDACASIVINMCYENDVNKNNIVKLKAPQTMVQRLLDNFKEKDVVVNLLTAISHLIHDSTTAHSVITLGAVQASVAVWTTFCNDVNIVKAALSVLERISLNITPEYMPLMIEEGGVQAILEILTSYPNNYELGLPTVTALCSLTTDVSMSDILIKRGACETIVNAINYIGYVNDFLDMAIKVLYNLTFSVNNFNRMIAAGVPNSIRTSLQQQVSSPQIICVGLGSIRNLCYSEEVCALFDSQYNMCSFVTTIWDRFLTTPQVGSDTVIIECASLLSALCRPEANALGVSTISIQLASTTLKQMLANTYVCREVCIYLANLFIHATISNNIMNTTILQDLIHTTRMHAQNPELLLIACKPLENLTYASQTIRDFMKQSQTIECMNDVIRYNQDRQDVVEAAKNVINAINRTDYIPSNYEFLDITRNQRNLKDVYDTLGQEKKETPDTLVELPPKIKNFLTAGALLTKHSKTAMPRPRHVYVTEDLKWLVWKDPKVKTVDEEQRMKIFKIRSVELGRCTPQLQRQKFGGAYLAKEDCAFSIQGRERTVDLEASTPQERAKWVNAVEHLIAYRKSIQSLRQTAAKFA